MDKFPGWAKWVVAVLIFAMLYGVARFLIFLDKGAVGKDGIG